MAKAPADNPCICGTPWRDYDNQCLRCKKVIDGSRAEQLSFHRKISEIGDCKCSETSLRNWGSRETSIANLYFCNFCDLKLPGKFEDLEDRQAKEEAEKLQALQVEYRSKVDQEVLRIFTDVQNGKASYLYRSIYVSVDSYNELGGQVNLLGNFNDSNVKAAGTRGWKVVGVIPRTAGGALENYSGFNKAWAGGIGGSVIGAYVLMELVVNSQNIDENRDLILESVQQYLAR